MTIIVGISVAPQDLQDYAGLVPLIQKWLNRSDLDALLPDFISLAEERMNRTLRVRQMEVALPETAIVDNAIPAPVGTVGVKSIWAVGHEQRPLKPQSFDFIQWSGSVGIPTAYAWQGDSLCFDGEGSVAGVLYQAIPALTAFNSTNWLMTKAPSAYLFGALKEGFEYVRNDAERDRWDARFQQVLAEIGGNDQRDRFSGPLQVRAR
jgi:hypothetical protein